MLFRSGCLMNIRGRVERVGKSIQVLHIAEVLNQTLQQEVR